MAEPIISVSGLRGIIGDSLTPFEAARYAAAFAAEAPAGPLVLARDGRTTGAMLAEILRGVLSAAGRKVIDAGIAATPTLGVLVTHLQAAGGVQISASHNPPEYNGLKLFSAQGQVLTAQQGEKVLPRYQANDFHWPDHHGVGASEILEDSFSEHLRRVLATVDVERIRGRRFRVLLDSNHGAGGLLGRRLLDELGCEVTHLGAEPTGKFAHVAEPTEENLRPILPRIVEAGAEVGFFQDPDADRLAAADANGRYLGEEYTLALCLDHVLAKQSGAAAANCATSRMSEEVVKKHGGRFFRSAVGEANVVEVMRTEKAVFGGEGNGGPIDPRVGYVRDSFVGMALILDALAEGSRTLAEWADSLPRFEIHKTKYPLQPQRLPAVFAALEERFANEAAIDRQDGLRWDWPDGRWLLVRPSNTEPIVRAIAEATDKQQAEQLCREAGDVIAK